MTDEDRVNKIHILVALQSALTFQMALVCPHCRKAIARRLRSDLPAMLTKAAGLAHAAQHQYGGEQHYQH